MKLNCKPGDLAIFVKSRAGNDGKIVRCLKYVGVYAFSSGFSEPAWEVDMKLMDTRGRLGTIVQDSALRPIRDNDGEDETLQWLEVPRKVAA